MVIKKVLNNNVAVTVDPHGMETVVMGRGLAFQRKAGDKIEPSKIEKTFTLSGRENIGRFQEILSSIPMEHIVISEKIIEYAKQKGERLNDCIYITLPDHISTAIERYKKNIVIENPLLWDIRRFYPDEFDIGLKANQIVFDGTGVKFAEDEAAFIAMHFVNAELNGQMENIYGSTQIIKDICRAVKEYFHIEFDESSLNYYRFINHLKFFAQRLSKKVCFNDAESRDKGDDLLEMIKLKHNNAFQCAIWIRKMIFRKYNYDFGNEEMLFLTIHIARVVRNS